MTVRLAHFYALRAHIEALILAEEQESGVGQERDAGSCPICGAAPEMVQDTSTLDGTQRGRCQKCGAEWER